jgi:hypothetical protein
MATPKRLTRKCTECRDGLMEGELQAIPNEIPSSSFQKIIPADYMPEIMKKHHFYKLFICNNLWVSENIFQLTPLFIATINII